MKRKNINLIIMFLMVLILGTNFSYGIFTPNIYVSEDKSIIAFAEINAVRITLPFGEVIHATNVNGGTNMNIQTITKPLEVTLVIDTSGSMASNNRMGKTKNAANTLVKRLFDSIDDKEKLKITVISFNSTAKVKVSSSSNINQIQQAIDSLGTGGQTGMSKGLTEAKNIFDNINTEDGELYKFLIVLTDGIVTDNANNSYNLLKEMNDNGVVIYDVLVEMNRTSQPECILPFSQNGVDIGTIYENVSSNEIEEIYGEIYMSICSEIVDSDVTEFVESAQNYYILNDDLYMFMDNELLQGSLLEIEYLVDIKSSIPCDEIEIQEEVDRRLNFSQNAKLISEDKTNADYGWTFNEHMSYKDGNDIILNIHETSKEGNFVIKRGGAYEAKVVLSRILTVEEEEHNYKNNLIFRLNKNGNMAANLEAIDVNIIPPFGENHSQKNVIILISILICILIIISRYLFRYHSKKNKV